MNIIEQMLFKYTINTENELVNALKEIYQEIALLGLYRGGFFQKAAFYGGTALRILHGLDRFSEDLDFTLFEQDTDFDLEVYFPYIIDEFEALGITISLSKKRKTNQTAIESAFLKNDTAVHTLNLEIDDLSNILEGVHSGKKLKIKFEVDTNPPQKFQTAAYTLLLPVTFNIIAMTLPNLYAGKLHALMFRNWKNRVKGRDWYDFEWYVKRGEKVNLLHLKERMVDSEHFKKEERLTAEYLQTILIEKIDTLDVEKAKQDINVFIGQENSIDYWSKDYFKLLVEKMSFEN